jgi:hypothetical protein
MTSSVAAGGLPVASRALWRFVADRGKVNGADDLPGAESGDQSATELLDLPGDLVDGGHR